jgi:hypothetical protein
MMELAVESLGYLAAILVFCAFYMRTMLPLRWIAIASNMAFLAYTSGARERLFCSMFQSAPPRGGEPPTSAGR